MSKRDTFPKPLAAFTSKKWGSKITRWIYTPLDKAIYKLTGGKRGLSPRKTVLYLTTTGRKSGQPRRVPILFLRDGDRYWVMASNFGQEHHPAWSHNLLAEPNALVQEGDRTVQVKARLGTAEERQRLWPQLVHVYPAWKNYVKWTNREFRLFCLEPR